MKKLENDNFFTFFYGLTVGIILTVLYHKVYVSRKPKRKLSENHEDYGTTSDVNLGSNKLVLVVRNDLKMGKGKVAAQCSHAAVMAHESARNNCYEIFKEWKRNGQPKIVVKVENEAQMLEIAKKARSFRLLVSIVSDAGRTQVVSGSKTVLAVGPGPEGVIDQVTGHLKLY